MVVKDVPVVYIAKPRLRINFDCAFCSAKYRTTDIKILHKCTECEKDNYIRHENYSIDSLSYYLGIVHINLRDKKTDTIKLRAMDSYIILLDSLVSCLISLGMRVIKDHKITDKHKKTKKDIEVREVILEKLGAIK